MDAGRSSAGGVGKKASAKLDQVHESGVTGLAELSVTASGVDLMVSISLGTPIRDYPVYIYAGTDCTDRVLQGPIWDDPRGQGISAVATVGSGSGVGFYTRLASDPKPWTIGGKAASDVLGHVLAVVDPDTMRPAACGRITAHPDNLADAGSAPSSVSMSVRAQVAGICVAKQVVKRSTSDACPDPVAYTDCAEMHCGLAACVQQQCADYARCLAKASDECVSGCAQTTECARCSAQITQCVLGHCLDVLACGMETMATLGGPCSQLEACCMRQGARTQYCLDLAHEAEKISGDATCIGLLSDHDFNTSLASDSPCYPDADAGTNM